MPPPKPPWYKQLKDSVFAKGMAMAAGKGFFEWAWGIIQQLFRQRAAQDLTGPPLRPIKGYYVHFLHFEQKSYGPIWVC